MHLYTLLDGLIADLIKTHVLLHGAEDKKARQGWHLRLCYFCNGACRWPRHLCQGETHVMKPDTKDAQIEQKANHVMLLTPTIF